MRSQPIPLFPLWIGGEPVTTTHVPLVSVNPADGSVNHHVSSAGADEVDQAVRVAARAAAAPSWRDMSAPARATVLHRIGDALLAHAEPMARMQRLENGKVASECIAQARAAAATFRYYASVCETLCADVTPARGGYLSMTSFEPHGVVAAITPWNSPLTMDAQKVAPALAAGNAVVLKPSELTSGTGLMLARIASEAGLPAGLLNVVPGPGGTTGAALVAHPGVGMVSFTGGTSSGRRIAAVAAQRLIPTALELGGKSPHIVFADADLDAAIDAVASGIFEGCGQSCVAGSRLFVQRAVYHQVVDRLAAKARALKVDMPDAPGAEMGPLVSLAHRAHVAAIVDEARADGAEVLAGGCAPDEERFARGAFYRPTVVAGIDNRAGIAQREIFGPVLCAMPFDDEDDLVAMANDTPYGLAAGVWTGDYRRGLRVARALQAGTVWINTYKQLSIATPFGGVKDSGLGREKGAAGLRLYQQSKALYLGL